MARGLTTVSGLREAAEITDQAIDVVLADPATESYPFTKGCVLDLIETLGTNTRAAEALTGDKPVWKRILIRTAILRAHPVKG